MCVCRSTKQLALTMHAGAGSAGDAGNVQGKHSNTNNAGQEDMQVKWMMQIVRMECVCVCVLCRLRG